MTLPTPDAQSSGLLPRRPASSTRSIPPSEPPFSPPFMATAIPTNGSAAGAPEKNAHEHAIDFATHSWDLATSGLKTMTAKRELPTRADRRSADTLSDASLTRSYTVILVVLTCVVLMLIGGGVVLFILLQP